MVHFSQTSLMSDVPLATSLPTTFTFHPNHQVADPSVVQQQQQQQQSIPSSTASSSSTKQHKQKQRSTSSDDQNSSNNQQTSGNDYETRLRSDKSSDIIEILNLFSSSYYFSSDVQIVKRGL